MDDKIPEFEILKRECSWLFNQLTDKLKVNRIIDLNFTPAFIKIFPKLYKLISAAFSVISIIITNKKGKVSEYRLYTWANQNGLKCGWLCRIEVSRRGFEILPEHQILLDNLGGIEETYSQIEIQDGRLTDNQNSLFTKSKCHQGLEDWAGLYQEECESKNSKQINTTDFICFASEANGNETFYDLKTNKVYLFAPDHSFENVEILEGQPEYTFYTINGVITFVDYVEILAEQWSGN